MRSLKYITTGSLLLSVLSCSHSHKVETGSVAKPAAPVAQVSAIGEGPLKRVVNNAKLRSYEEHQLANGLKVLLVNDTTLPYVSYSLALKNGSNADPKDFAGLGHFVAELLETGTSKKSAAEIATELSKLAAEFDQSVSSDFTTLSSSCLSEDASALLDIFHDLVTQPSFTNQEIERKRKELIAEASKTQDNPEAFAEKAWFRYLYSGHPYGHTSLGQISNLKNMTKKQIIQYYLKYYRPNNATLVIVGKYTPELIEKAESLFGAWQARDLAPVVYPPVVKVTGQEVLIVDKPGLVQAQIRIGNLGIKRTSEDFLTIRIANTILGGAFSSRLVDRVRKELGLTYSISSGFDARQDSGPFEISTFTKVSSVGKTIEESLAVLKKFHDSGVSSAEAEMSKGYLKGIFPTAIETAEKFAHNLVVLKLYGIDDSYLTQYISNVDKTTADDLNRVIKNNFDDKNLKILVYGPADQIKDQLKNFKVEVKPAADFQ